MKPHHPDGPTRPHYEQSVEDWLALQGRAKMSRWRAPPAAPSELQAERDYWREQVRLRTAALLASRRRR